jgi:hypothetical protein
MDYQRKRTDIKHKYEDKETKTKRKDRKTKDKDKEIKKVRKREAIHLVKLRTNSQSNLIK